MLYCFDEAFEVRVIGFVRKKTGSGETGMVKCNNSNHKCKSRATINSLYNLWPEYYIRMDIKFQINKNMSYIRLVRLPRQSNIAEVCKSISTEN